MCKLTSALARHVRLSELAAIAASSDAKAHMNLALLFHGACSALRASDIANLNVDDGAVCGDSTMTPLVAGVAPDGTVIEGILDRVGTITDTDILDTEDASLYGSGLIHGVSCAFAHSLRKMRASYMLSQGSSMTDVMLHDGLSSGAESLPYARRATAGQLQRRTGSRRRLRGLSGFQRLRGVYEPPDVVGVQRYRDEYRRVAPNLSEAELAYGVNLYERHMSPATRRSYEAVLRPFYSFAARAGVDPLTCDPALLGAHIVHLMCAGKIGADGNRDPNKPYSPGYFQKFLAAHRCATEAKGLPDITGLVDLKKLLRGYNRVRGSELPR